MKPSNETAVARERLRLALQRVEDSDADRASAMSLLAQCHNGAEAFRDAVLKLAATPLEAESIWNAWRRHALLDRPDRMEETHYRMSPAGGEDLE